MSQTQDTVNSAAAGGGPVDVDRSLHPDYKKDSGTWQGINDFGERKEENKHRLILAML